MTVVYVSPGKASRFEGGLGPLQSMGLSGSMTWKFDAQEKGTTIEVRYAVGGYNPGGLKEVAPLVDGDCAPSSIGTSDTSKRASRRP